MDPNTLPVITLPRLKGNEPATLNTLQEILIPHLSTIHTFYWCAWWGVLAYLIAEYLLIPFITNLQNPLKKSHKKST